MCPTLASCNAINPHERPPTSTRAGKWKKYWDNYLAEATHKHARHGLTAFIVKRQSSFERY